MQSSFLVRDRSNPYMFLDMAGAVTVKGVPSCRFLAWDAVATAQFFAVDHDQCRIICYHLNNT